MICFGGRGGDGTEEALNELVILAVEKLSWTRPRTTGDPPPPRQAHAAAFVKDSILIHGGFCNGKQLGDSFMYRITFYLGLFFLI